MSDWQVNVMSKIKTGVYKHFKGQKYEVLGVARHSETLELLVVYKALYGEGDIWVRPIEMFADSKQYDGNTVPRFEYVGENP